MSTTSRSRPARPLTRLVGGALAISLSPVFVKIAAREGLGPTSIAFWRLALGAAPLFALALARGARLTLPRSLLVLAAAAAAVFVLDLYLWHRAITLVGAGMATILGNTQVFNTALLTWLLFRERPARSFYAAAALGLTGVVLLVGVGSGTSFTGDYLRGVLFGIGTGMAYAVYLVTTRAMAGRRERPPLVTVVAWLSALAALGSLLVCATEDDQFLPRGVTAWAALAGLGVLVQAVGWWAITSALPQVRGATGGLVLLLQPVLATAWGAVLFAESLETIQLIGAALTLTAIYLGTAGLPGLSRASRGQPFRPLS